MTGSSVEATMRKFDRMFERRPDPRNHRSTWRDRAWIAKAYLSDLLDIRMVRIPLIFSQAATMTWNLSGSRSESIDHQLIKHAALVWMDDHGVGDARMEVYGVYGGRPDVYSREAHWIIECGNTPIDKVRQAAFDPKPPRFTLIPFQRPATYAYLNGMKTVGLLGIDITWSDDLRIQLEEAEAEEVRNQPVIEFKRSRPTPTASRSEVTV